jgi:hypothetical protein
VASQRGDSGDVDLIRSGPLIDDLTMPVVLVCDRRSAPCGHGGAALGSSAVDDPADVPHE